MTDELIKRAEGWLAESPLSTNQITRPLIQDLLTALKGKGEQGMAFITSIHRKPPAHRFYGDNYERGNDPFAELKGENPVSGWFLLDSWGNQIAFCADGTVFKDESEAKLITSLEIISSEEQNDR